MPDLTQRQRWAAPDRAPVPGLPSALPPLERVQLFVLQRVVGPYRRRFWKRRELPPPLSGPEILRRVVELPIKTWSYEFEPGVRHLGPMAQDFAAAFGLGRTNRMIENVDGLGVALTAIQGLHRRLEALESRLAEVERRLEARESGASQR